MSDRRLELEAMIYGWPEDQVERSRNEVIEEFLDSDAEMLVFSDGAPPSMVVRSDREAGRFIDKEVTDGEDTEG